MTARPGVCRGMAKFKDINLLDVGNTIQLVGALWAGNGHLYLCMFPEDEGGIMDVEGNDCVAFVTAKGDTLTAEALNMDTDEWNTFIRQTDLLETEVLAKAADDKVTKVIIRKSARNIAQNVSWEVYHRDEFKCRYCGAGPGIPLTVDHLVLWEEGGPNLHANLLTSCRKCNKARGNMQYADWLQSPFYKRASQGLTAAVREANLAIVPTLDAIPRNLHKPSKRK